MNKFFCTPRFLLPALLFIAQCSNAFEAGAVFRGDSSVRFSVTSIEMEENQSRTITLSLLSKPTNTVSFQVLTGDSTEVTIDPVDFTFTPANYSTPQIITVTTHNDCISDGTQNTQLSLANIVTADPKYQAESVNIPVTVSDSADNLPNIVFSKTHSLETSELGTKDFFSVYLSCDPGVDVTVPLEVSDTAEVALDKSSLTFNSANFSTPQLVTITGLSDCTLDADQLVTIRTRNVTTSAGTDFNRYHDTNPTTYSRRYSFVTVTNRNYALQNEIIVSIPPGGLDMNVTSNSTAHTDPFAVVSAHLSCPISSPVAVGFSITSNVASVVNTSSGNLYLSFDSTNWSTDQTALVRIKDNTVIAPGTYFLNIYESNADNAQPPPAIPASIYTPKSFQLNMTIN